MTELNRKVACGLRQIAQSMASNALSARRPVQDWQDRINGFAAELEAGVQPWPMTDTMREKIARAIYSSLDLSSELKDDMARDGEWARAADAVLALIEPVMDGGRECFGLLDEMDTLSRSGESKYGTGELMLRVGNALDKHRAARRPLRSQTAGEP